MTDSLDIETFNDPLVTRTYRNYTNLPPSSTMKRHSQSPQTTRVRTKFVATSPNRNKIDSNRMHKLVKSPNQFGFESESSQEQEYLNKLVNIYTEENRKLMRLVRKKKSPS